MRMAGSLPLILHWVKHLRKILWTSLCPVIRMAGSLPVILHWVKHLQNGFFGHCSV